MVHGFGFSMKIRGFTNGMTGDSRGFTGACGRSCAGMVCMASVGPEWSHNMAHALALDPWTWQREDVPGLGLIDEDVDLLRGVYVTSRPKA
jgi:hypothetical protein